MGEYASLPRVNASLYGKIVKHLGEYEPLVGDIRRVYLFNKGALAINNKTNEISVRGKLPEPLGKLLSSTLQKIEERRIG